MNLLLQQIIDNPAQSLLIIGNLILIESLLSVDNAAVLATMVMDLPEHQRKRALKYGIFGAYLFRGICLLLATYLVKIWWLKAVGGAYLVYLFIGWLQKRNKQEEKAEKNKEDSKLYSKTVGRLGNFWATIISVELMDLAFSLDNVFAAVAYSSNILIIMCGVFIGILAMRFVAQGFITLMEKFPFLEGSAYLVIGILGVKLVLSLYEHFYPESDLTKVLESEKTDGIISALTIAVFFIPVLTSLLLGYPKRRKP